MNILMNSTHPNVIKIFEIYESQRSLYIIMEECKGGDIFDRMIEHIQSKSMYSEKDAVEMLQHVMSAIDYCHNNGIFIRI